MINIRSMDAAAVCMFILLLFLSGTCCECRRPLLRKPRDAPTTGRYFVVLNDKATEEDMQQLAARVARVSDDAKVYGMVHKVAKAFTVKLSPYALEMVCYNKQRPDTCTCIFMCSEI